MKKIFIAVTVAASFFVVACNGGSKTEAKKLFETALAKFDAFKPATELDPKWGRPAAEYFLSQIK